MNNSAIDNIIDDLYQMLPLVMKKFLRMEQSRSLKGISRQDLAIMGMLLADGTLPTSEIGRRLLISKPQMTHVIDRLISLKMVDRLPNKMDRRVIKIKLTRKGRNSLEKSKNLMRNTISQKLASLNQKELKRFSVSLTALKEISRKLE